MSEAIAQDRERCQLLFRLMKNAMLCRPARPESDREARERFPWLTLASGFRLLRSFGLDRLDAAARGWQGQMAADLDDYRRIFNLSDDLQLTAAVGAVGIMY